MVSWYDVSRQQLIARNCPIQTVTCNQLQIRAVILKVFFFQQLHCVNSCQMFESCELIIGSLLYNIILTYFWMTEFFKGASGMLYLSLQDDVSNMLSKSRFLSTTYKYWHLNVKLQHLNIRYKIRNKSWSPPSFII